MLIEHGMGVRREETGAQTLPGCPSLGSFGKFLHLSSQPSSKLLRLRLGLTTPKGGPRGLPPPRGASEMGERLAWRLHLLQIQHEEASCTLACRTHVSHKVLIKFLRSILSEKKKRIIRKMSLKVFM